MKRLLIVAILSVFLAPSISFGTVLEEAEKKAQDPQFVQKQRAVEAQLFFSKYNVLLDSNTLSAKEQVSFFLRAQNNNKLLTSLTKAADFMNDLFLGNIFAVVIRGGLQEKVGTHFYVSDSTGILYVDPDATDEEIIRELSLPK